MLFQGQISSQKKNINNLLPRIALKFTSRQSWVFYSFEVKSHILVPKREDPNWDMVSQD